MVVGVIPARLGSSRFPKKILAPLAGKPMVVHAIEQAQKSEKLDKVILAIDSEETKGALADFDFEIIMTDSNHITKNKKTHYREPAKVGILSLLPDLTTS